MTESTLSGPTTQRKRPSDFTGLQTERLTAKQKAEKQQASARIAMVTATEAEESNEIVDYSGVDIPLPEIEVQDVVINNPYRTIRVNTKIEQMTFGRRVADPGDMEANPPRPPIMGDLPMYTFEEGRSYRVPKEMAEHLQSKGYLAYIGT